MRTLTIARTTGNEFQTVESRAQDGGIIRELLEKTDLPTRRRDGNLIIRPKLAIYEVVDSLVCAGQAARFEVKIVNEE
jgi:hypothetical protein